MNAPADSFDYIIVGAGSAGCVLANRLTASGRHRVLLLEAGGHDRNLWIHIPLGYGKLFTDARVNWLYTSEPEPELNNRNIIQPRGKVLGGSSSINGLLYVRGQREDFDHWRQLGNTGWSFEDVLPYFRSAEHQERGADDAARQSAGRSPSPTCASRIRCARRSSRRRSRPAFRATTISTARPRKAPAISSSPHATAGAGRPRSAICKPARRRRNLDGRDRRARDPHAVRRPARRRRRVPARRRDPRRRMPSGEVILAGGAFNSPQLLQLSGVGPAALLRAHRHRRGRRHAGRRRRSAGSFPGPLAVPLHRADHHERHDAQLAPPRAAPACATRCSARAAHDRRRLCRRLLPHQPAVATPDVQVHFIIFSADKIGATLHPFPGLHRVGLPVAPGEPRLCAHQVGRSGRRRPRSSRATCRAVRPGHGGRRHEIDAPDHEAAGDARVTSPRSVRPGRSKTSDADLLAFARDGRHHRVPPDQHLPDGRRCQGRGRRAAAGARHRATCAWSTARSCRPSCPATPTPRSS